VLLSHVPLPRDSGSYDGGSCGPARGSHVIVPRIRRSPQGVHYQAGRQ
jgi:hypothetical protein